MKIGDRKFPKPLDSKYQLELLKLYQEQKDNNARDLVILHNLRLVVFLINRYFRQDSDNEFDDYFQEGIIGLMKAIETFDSEKGSFSNHASINIRSSIQAYIRDKAPTIRIPAHAYEDIARIEVFRRDYTNINSIEPTYQEISEALSMPYWKVEKLMKIDTSTISIDTPIQGTEDILLGDSIEDPNSDFNDRVCGKVFVEEFIKASSEYLDPIEHKLFILSTGLNCEPYEMTVVSKILGLEYKNAVNMKSRVLTKIRKSSHVKALYQARKSDYGRRFNRELDYNTSWYKSPTYNTDRVQSGRKDSPVERIVLERESMTKKLIEKRND